MLYWTGLNLDWIGMGLDRNGWRMLGQTFGNTMQKVALGDEAEMQSDRRPLFVRLYCLLALLQPRLHLQMTRAVQCQRRGSEEWKERRFALSHPVSVWHRHSAS